MEQKEMEKHLYSIEKVADLLGMQKKTIMRYIKEGKLNANKVGGRWRIHGNDLTSFVGTKGDSDATLTCNQKPKADITPEPWVSAVVHVGNKEREEFIRISNTLIAIKSGGDDRDGRCRIDAIYFEEELKIQILIWGTLDFTGKILKIMEELLK
jgi:excisionase family DNA binding protein